LKSVSCSRGILSTQFRPPVLIASSVGCTACLRLGEGEEGTVHGVFDSAINVFFAGGLVCLVPEFVQDGPLSVTLRVLVGSSKLPCLGVRDGDKLKVHDSRLELGDRRLVSFGSARIYSPRQKFASPMLANDEIEANLEVVRKTALLFGNTAGLGELLALFGPKVARTGGRALNIFASAAVGRIIRLEQAFRSENKKALKDAIRDFIGLGPGLTPSSDDVLSGLVLLCVLYAQNIRGVQRANRLLAQAIAEEARGRTTLVSEEFLRQAALGNGNKPVMRQCEALLTGRQELAELETKRVLAIGETSGTDITLGIVLGTMLCIGKHSGLEKGESV
jgi:hypothetical protein